jgi:hypothetical protein
MKHISIGQPGGPGTNLQFEGFPDAVKVVALTDPCASRVAHLVLHITDLRFAEECLTALAGGQAEPMRRSLWESAVVNYFKCFGSSAARFQLNAAKIYGSNPLALENFHFFKSMRDKHFVHDENGYLQGRPGAVINGPQSAFKIAKIVTFTARADIVGQANFTNFQLLVQDAKAWAVRAHDELCDGLTVELEQRSREFLMAMPELQYRTPTLDDAAKKWQP